MWEAATDIGFFQLVNHGIEIGHIQDAFAMAERLFDLPEARKARYPLRDGQNAGWETRAQIRPSTGTADQKESYQVTLPRMEGLWPGRDVLAGFQENMLKFETGQGGLQLCPGKEAGSNDWTSVQPKTEIITCNIGDMLMRWSDDQLRSTLHRVRMPETGEFTGPSYSLAYFCQANRDKVIEGPGKNTRQSPRPIICVSV